MKQLRSIDTHRCMTNISHDTKSILSNEILSLSSHGYRSFFFFPPDTVVSKLFRTNNGITINSFQEICNYILLYELFSISRIVMSDTADRCASRIENVVIAQQHLLIEATITDRINGLAFSESK